MLIISFFNSFSQGRIYLKFGFGFCLLLSLNSFGFQNNLKQKNSWGFNKFELVIQQQDSISKNKAALKTKVIKPEDNMTAEFPGGMPALYKFINKTLIYPEEAKRERFGGKVFVRFIIETDGSLSDITIMKSIRYGCDEEAIRILKAMPKWNPAVKDGVKIRSSFKMPIVFKLK